MKMFLNELNKIKVLSKEDILTIKNYIKKKYPENTSSKNAAILSETVSKVIYDNLKGLPEEIKPSIKKSILKDAIVNNYEIITLEDVFEVCIKNEEVNNDFTEELVEWINLNTKIQFTIEEVKDYLKEEYLKNDSSFVKVKKDGHSQDKVLQTEKKDYMKVNSESNGHTNDKVITDCNENQITSLKTNVDDKEEIDEVINKKINIETDAQDNEERKDYSRKKLLKLDKFKNIKSIVIVVVIVISLCGAGRVYYSNANKGEKKKEVYVTKTQKTSKKNIKYVNSHMPEYMRYEEIDEKKLREFLCKRNSLLADEPYFKTMISVAREYNLNPVLLFSITGQEQNFVPKSTSNAKTIANNPFNVYHSWMEYNTDINDSAKIAARTVINLSKGRPQKEDPFEWIGKKYAEDRNWGRGVKVIFKQLTEYVK